MAESPENDDDEEAHRAFSSLFRTDFEHPVSLTERAYHSLGKLQPPLCPACMTGSPSPDKLMCRRLAVP